MSAADRQRWDAIYHQRANQPYPAPDPLLFQHTPPPANGSARALDLAAGLAQNGLWLAAQGYTVDVMEISRVALTRAQAEAAARGLHRLNFFQVDLENAALERDVYDFVCVFRFLQRDFFSQLRTVVKPGGRLVYQTFNVNHLDQSPDFNRAYLLESGELTAAFSDWHIVYSREHSDVSQLVAIKP